jgi:hypothetical protein
MEQPDIATELTSVSCPESGINLRTNTCVTNGKGLSPPVNKVCAKYCMECQEGK